jgi:hypothetical protein
MWPFSGGENISLVGVYIQKILPGNYRRKQY